MKKYIFIALFLVKILELTAQTSRFKDGETLNVWATSGLNMRDKPDAKATKIAAIPYGAKVVVQPNIGVKIPFEVEEFKGFTVKGLWLLVKYGDKEGFVFDGFLSRLPAPIPTEQDLAIETYLHQQIGEIGEKYEVRVGGWDADTLRSVSSNEKVDFSKSEMSYAYKQKYKNQIQLELFSSSLGSSKNIIFPNISLFEGYVLVKTYHYDKERDAMAFDKKTQSIKIVTKTELEAPINDSVISKKGDSVVIKSYFGD